MRLSCGAPLAAVREFYNQDEINLDAAAVGKTKARQQTRTLFVPARRCLETCYCSAVIADGMFGQKTAIMK
jgi:hypothetical protein